jgi:drug/metabolite transporter (DMT)-like permease
MAETEPAAVQRNTLDWTIFAILTLFWAGAYVLTRLAVGKGTAEGLPPYWILAGRLTIGALTLTLLAIAARAAWPPISDRRRWGYVLAMGLTNALIPFFLITTAQKEVDASLAALYAAASPVFTALGASVLFAQERLSWRAGIGIGLGFLGVAVLFGADALAATRISALWAQGALIVAALAYAASTLIARAAPPMPPLSFAAAYVGVGAALSWPMVFLVPPETVEADAGHWAAVLALGLGSSGIAQALYMWLVARAGATFLSLVGYVIPLGTAALGWLVFGETQGPKTLIAFALILGGIWLARQSGQGKTRS